MFGIAQVDLAETGEGLAMAAGSRRQHAVEHVDAARHRFENVLRRADTHEIARVIGGEMRNGVLDGLQHQLLAFADRQSTDGIAFEPDGFQALRALAAQAWG